MSDDRIITVVELVGRSAPIGVSQLNIMPLDLRIIQNFFSNLHFVFIYFIIQNALIKIDIGSRNKFKLTITLHDFDRQLKCELRVAAWKSGN